MKLRVVSALAFYPQLRLVKPAELTAVMLWGEVKLAATAACVTNHLSEATPLIMQPLNRWVVKTFCPRTGSTKEEMIHRDQRVYFNMGVQGGWLTAASAGRQRNCSQFLSWRLDYEIETLTYSSLIQDFVGCETFWFYKGNIFTFLAQLGFRSSSAGTDSKNWSLVSLLCPLRKPIPTKKHNIGFHCERQFFFPLN